MTDRSLQEQVQKALDWEPSVDAAAIGVSVDDGVVTLRGDVKTFAEKADAERAALRIYGVEAVANDIAVRVGKSDQRTDTEIAQAIVSAFKWNTMVPDETITVCVVDGWVTLRGHLDREYQRRAATDAVRCLAGVRGLNNLITLEPQVSVADVKANIEAALTRSAEVDARRINVVVTDRKVVLSGNVHSWAERNEARHAAWAAPGVTDVEDRMAVEP